MIFSDKEAEAKVEKDLDNWDSFLVEQGYTYIGDGQWEVPNTDTVWYVATKSEEEQPIRVFIINKTFMLKNKKTARPNSDLYQAFTSGGTASINDNIHLLEFPLGRKALDMLKNEPLIWYYHDSIDPRAEVIWPKIEEDVERRVALYKKRYV